MDTPFTFLHTSFHEDKKGGKNECKSFRFFKTSCKLTPKKGKNTIQNSSCDYLETKIKQSNISFLDPQLFSLALFFWFFSTARKKSSPEKSHKIRGFPRLVQLLQWSKVFAHLRPMPAVFQPGMGKDFQRGIPSLKLRARPLKNDSWKTIVSFWDGLFSEASS